jgi:hypothetical protein
MDSLGRISRKTTFGIPNTLPPLSIRELRGYLWFGGVGFLLLVLGVSPELPLVRWSVVLAIACWCAVPAVGFFKQATVSSRAKGRDAMSAQIRLYTIVVIVFSVAFAIWARQLGLSWPTVIGAVMLIDAFANMIAALTEWWRMSMFGHSVGLAICGFGFPFVGIDGWAFLLGTSLLVGSILAAGILYLQVRQHEKTQLSLGSPSTVA